MSSYDFIVDNICFSYSSVSTFETCPYSFKLAYIDIVPRENNFFAEYGTLIHKCIEKYFTKEIDLFELPRYYNEKYDEIVKSFAPPSSVDLGARYRDQGQFFFENFSLTRDDYEVLQTEDKIDFELHGLSVTARPDLVLQEKKTRKNILFDYKTSAPFKTDKRNGKETTDNKKLDGYYKQMYLYAYALKNYRNIKIDKITLLFTRPERLVTVKWNLKDEKMALNWFLETVQKIKKSEEFPFDNSSPYFCSHICGVRNSCEYKPNA